MKLFTVRLERFHVTTTRSRHNDTDTVVLVTQTGQNVPVTQSFSAGDVNDGDHDVGLSSVHLNSDGSVPLAFSFTIYNGDASKLSQNLAQMTEDVSDRALDQFLHPDPDASGPIDYTDPSLSSGGGGDDSGSTDGDPPDFSDVDWENVLMLLGLGDFIFPDCDGFVAAGGAGTSMDAWEKLIDAAGNTATRTVRFPGANSPAGCGGNSDYNVTWSVSRQVVTGSLRQFLKDNKLSPNPGLRSLG